MNKCAHALQMIRKSNVEAQLLERDTLFVSCEKRVATAET